MALPVAVAAALVCLAIINIALVKTWRGDVEDGVLWRDEAGRVAIYLLLLLFLVKDLVSIPAVLGNTPLTFLVWLLLGLAVGEWREAAVARGAAPQEPAGTGAGPRAIRP